ncbi:MAG: AraC family transcriptional regulator [Rhodopseudomonas sp.]|uniref:AraC family transcriptional regulator n=1 Tax=Rhodopseudomonas sp. TaxID=1078 RepID=UPI00179A109C|nr:AraC family transcriptional regulator [Rhodopseudomonas sp.]NVN85599.1 AraC family transcriptional regulator [Rhodopseudomonas sp.]
MRLELLGEPLNRFPAVNTFDPEEFGHALKTIYGAIRCEISVRDDFEARGNLVQMQDLTLGFNSCVAPATVAYGESDFARLQIAVTGSAATTVNGVTTAIDIRQSCITSPGQAATMEYGAGYQQLLLRIKTRALEEKLIALMGSKPKGSLEFVAAASNENPQATNLRQLVTFLSGQLNSSPVALPSLVLGELQQAVTLSFLSAYQHSFSRFMESEVPAAAPRHVRQVEEYIEANWKQPITIEKLMAVTDISARGIFKAFQRSRGYSPMAFAKRIRLQHARKMLAEPGIGVTVTAVAFACGFSNLGHFAKDYREMFGEKPSDTLERARRSRDA